MGTFKGLVVFDIDGTLIDSNPAHQASLLEVLSAYRFPDLNTRLGLVS